jgi:tRNA threonylcarbamoyl adenosine modification protein YeaZ
MELAIDTSTEIASVAVSSEGVLVSELTWRAGHNHTAELMPNLVTVLHGARIDLKNIDGIVVASGPGSFNGLRVGMSVAKGLGFALGAPLVGVSTLEVAAYPHSAPGLPVCSIISAGRGDIAAAIFRLMRGKWLRLLEERVTTPDELVAGIGSTTVFCGVIPPEAASRISQGLGRKAVFAAGASAPRRAGYLAELGWKRLSQGDHDHSPTLQPMYLKRPAITVSRKWRY